MSFYKIFNRAEAESADLYISGDIIDNNDAEWYQWLGLDSTAPKAFKQGLDACGGKPINVYIDSYGGLVFAGAAIYTMLREYKGKVTVKVSSIAASAASVIAMAGDEIYMSPTAMLMIHNPETSVSGDEHDMKRAVEMLKSVKESIINAYERKTGLSRDKLSAMMDKEKWLSCNEALELGFADGVLGDSTGISAEIIDEIKASKMAVYNSVSSKIAEEHKRRLAAEKEEADKKADNERKFKHAAAQLDLINIITGGLPKND